MRTKAQGGKQSQAGSTEGESVEAGGLRLAWGSPASWKARWRDESQRRYLELPLSKRLQAALSLVMPRSDDEQRSA